MMLKSKMELFLEKVQMRTLIQIKIKHQSFKSTHLSAYSEHE